MELVVREHDHRHGRVPEIVGEFEMESIMVDKDGIKRSIKELSRHSAFELVESQIEKLQARKAQYHNGKLSGEAIIAQIELKKQL